MQDIPTHARKKHTHLKDWTSGRGGRKGDLVTIAAAERMRVRTRVTALPYILNTVPERATYKAQRRDPKAGCSEKLIRGWGGSSCRVANNLSAGRYTGADAGNGKGRRSWDEVEVKTVGREEGRGEC